MALLGAVNMLNRFDACVLERYSQMMRMSWKKMENYCLKVCARLHQNGDPQENKSKDIQVNCGLLFPEFSTLTPCALKAFIYTFAQL